MLSASGSGPSRPAPSRSSGTCATPCRRSARAPVPVTGRPATSIRPLAASSVPPITSASSRWPLPETPTMPRISPPRSSSETWRSGIGCSGERRVLTPSSASSTGPGAISARAGGVSSWPHISIARRRAVMLSSLAAAATTAPWRITTRRSVIARTSPSLWLMKITPKPCAASARIAANRPSVSCGVSTEVGSSRISTRAPR